MTDRLHVSLLGKNALIREGLRHILTREHFDVVASVEDASKLESSDYYDQDKAIFVVDQGAGAYGRADIEALGLRYPNARIVLLAETFDFDDMVEAFRAGARGYIVKDIACESLVGSLHLVALGERVLPGALVDRLPTNPSVPSAPVATQEIRDLLSDREVEILRCLVIGYPNKLISRRLDISEATVKVHVKAILRKLKVQNRTQAAIYALHHGLSGDVGIGATPVMSPRRDNVSKPGFRLPPPAVIADHAVAA